MSWEDDGKLHLNSRPESTIDVQSDLVSAKLEAMKLDLEALRSKLATANIDQRFVIRIEEVARLANKDTLTAVDVFRIGHGIELLSGYVPRAKAEWNELLASELELLVENARQSLGKFSIWRAFDQAEADIDRVEHDVAPVEVAVRVAEVAEVLKTSGREVVATEVPVRLDEVAVEAKEAAERVDVWSYRLSGLSRDAANGISNIVRSMAELLVKASQKYASAFSEEFVKRAGERGRHHARIAIGAIEKTVKGILVAGGIWLLNAHPWLKGVAKMISRLFPG